MQTNDKAMTMTSVDTTALTIIGEKQRVAGEASKEIAVKMMTAIENGKIEIASQVLDAIETATDAHKGNKGIRHAYTYAAIAQCRETLGILKSFSDAIGTPEWNRYCDVLRAQLLLVSSHMPSSVSDGQAKNVALSDMLRGLKSVTRATGRTDLAYIPTGKASDTLESARKAEAERIARREAQAVKTQAIPQPATPAETPAKPAKPTHTRKATTTATK